MMIKGSLCAVHHDYMAAESFAWADHDRDIPFLLRVTG